MIEVSLRKQQALDVDPNTIQQIDFTGNLENNATIFFERILFELFTRNRENIVNSFYFLSMK